MGRVACFDDAVAGLFVATLNTELVHTRHLADQPHVRTTIYEYLGGVLQPPARYSA
jgi:hypothetical protein